MSAVHPQGTTRNPRRVREEIVEQVTCNAMVERHRYDEADGREEAVMVIRWHCGCGEQRYVWGSSPWDVFLGFLRQLTLGRSGCTWGALPFEYEGRL